MAYLTNPGLICFVHSLLSIFHLQNTFNIEHSLGLCLDLLTEENICGFRFLESKLLPTPVISVVLCIPNRVNLLMANIVWFDNSSEPAGFDIATDIEGVVIR